MTGFVDNLNQDTANFNSNYEKKRKLILHFDQHNTIQVACTLPGRRITVEEGLNNFLTSAVWGKEVNDEWVWISTEPQLSKPIDEPFAITYFKYLEKKIVKSPDDRAELKKKTCQFVYEEPGTRFREFFDLYLQSLTYDSNWNPNNGICKEEENDNNNSYYFNDNNKSSDNNNSNVSISNEITKIKLPSNTIPAGDLNKISSLYHLILPEFFDMIRRLQKSKRNFSIILRTMGIDSHNFLDTIKPVIEGKHRDFKDLELIKINPNIGHIRRSANDKIELEMDGQVFTEEESIYEKLNSLEGINAIRDDFAYWQSNNYECYSAKPLWVNLNDNLNQHIIFDDNIRLDSFDDCIVNIRLMNTNSNEYVNIDFDSYNIFEKSSILQPNLIQLLNPHLRRDSTKNHYYEKIRKAEKIYDRILENKTNLKFQTKSIDEMDSSTGSCKIALLKMDENNENVNGDKNITNSNNNTIIDNQKNDQKIVNELCNDIIHHNVIDKIDIFVQPSANKSFSKENDFANNLIKRKNLRIGRTLSIQIEEEEKQIERADKKQSTICLIQ